MFSPLSSELAAGDNCSIELAAGDNCSIEPAPGGPGGLEPKQSFYKYYDRSDDYYTANPFPVMKTGFPCVHISTLLSLQGSYFYYRESC